MKTATEHGVEDCRTTVNEGVSASELAECYEDADESLINAMGTAWVLREAGAGDAEETDELWERVGVPWCEEYSRAYRAEAVRLARSTSAMAGRWNAWRYPTTAEIRSGRRETDMVWVGAELKQDDARDLILPCGGQLQWGLDGEVIQVDSRDAYDECLPEQKDDGK